MSYDGGLVIRAENEVLLKIFKQHLKKNIFGEFQNFMKGSIGAKYKGKTLAFEYIYLDCSYVDRCPSSVGKVTDYIQEVIEYYCDEVLYTDGFKEFILELKNRSKEITNAYTFVDWIYFRPDEDGGGVERFILQDGKETYMPKVEGSALFDLDVGNYYGY